MFRHACAGAILFLCVSVVGCSKTTSDQDAIRAGIDKRLSGLSDINLSAMDHDIKQISIDGDHATAQVEFRLKQGDARMEIEYTLQRQGNEWKVLSSQPLGDGGSHGGTEGMPSNPPGTGSGSLPPGHPQVN